MRSLAIFGIPSHVRRLRRYYGLQSLFDTNGITSNGTTDPFTGWAELPPIKGGGSALYRCALVCMRWYTFMCVRVCTRARACCVCAHVPVARLPCMHAPVKNMLCRRIPKGWEIIRAVVPDTIPAGKLKMCNDSNGDIYINADEFGNSWYRCCCVALHTHLGHCARGARRHEPLGSFCMPARVVGFLHRSAWRAKSCTVGRTPAVLRGVDKPLCDCAHRCMLNDVPDVIKALFPATASADAATAAPAGVGTKPNPTAPGLISSARAGHRFAWRFVIAAFFIPLLLSR